MNTIDINASTQADLTAHLRVPAPRHELEFVTSLGARRSFTGTGQSLVSVSRGELLVNTAEGRISLFGGDVGVFHGPVEVYPAMAGCGNWSVVNGTDRSWSQALRHGSSDPTAAFLLPGVAVCPPELRHGLIAAQRARLHRRPMTAVNSAELTFLVGVHELQTPWHRQVQACPGRTLQQRRNVYFRLQRVRNHVLANSTEELRTSDLAAMANYSPWHFIRIFCDVFGETPHDFLVRHRLNHARRLLHTSSLAIREVALAAGFEHRCTFARLFREHYGTSAQSYRQSLLANAA